MGLVTVNKAEDAEEAETKTAEAKPIVPLTYTYPYTYTHPYAAYRPTVYSGHYVSPFVHTVVTSVATKKVEKREAEATPEAEADPYLLYANHGVLPYHYNPYVYHPLVIVNKAEDAEEAETKSAEVKPIVPLTYTYPYTYHPSVYSGHVVSPFLHSVVPSVATKKVEKREADAAPEAEADPWLYYSNAGYAPYAPYYRSFAGYQPHTYGYNPYAYRYFGYGK